MTETSIGIPERVEAGVQGRSNAWLRTGHTHLGQGHEAVVGRTVLGLPQGLPVARCREVLQQAEGGAAFRCRLARLEDVRVGGRPSLEGDECLRADGRLGRVDKPCSDIHPVDPWITARTSGRR
jgi:hypothetical protein